MYIGKTRLGNMGRNYYRGDYNNSELSWFGKIWRHFWVGSIMIMMLLGISLILLIGYLMALSTPIFKLEDVGFKGLKRVSQAELLHQGGLENQVNLLALNLSDVKRKMETVPWVKNVSLQRIFPNKLQVMVNEHQPIFLVLAQQELHFLNNEGLLFKKVEAKEGGALPLLTGLGKKDWTPERRLTGPVLKEIVTLQTLLSQGKDPLYPGKLSEVHYDPDCGFSLFTLERGIRITLGKEELETRIKRLEKVWVEIEKRPNLYTLKGISLQFGQRVIVHGLKPKSIKGT
jgi:cell division protein FtsQ